MNKNVISDLYDVVKTRKNEKTEGSYTCYLFEKGLDKILKKVGEEAAETIIAAKNKNKEELTNEVCDLLYHVLVLLANENIEIDEIFEILEQRRAKIGNLKVMKNTDLNT